MSGSAAPGPEHLEPSGGSPVPPAPSSSRKSLLVAVGVLAALGVAGAAAWAAVELSGGGAQPSEALPGSTLGYVGLDLDPSAGQKVEALRTLGKFPAFEDELGIGEDDDPRRALFEKLQESGACTDLDYDRDIAPWLGERAAFAAVRLDGAKEPEPVAVVAVTDAEKADTGVRALQACDDAAPSDRGAAVVAGDWLYVADDQTTAQQVADLATQESLADDADFQRWTQEAGEPGVVTLYAAPAAGQYVADQLGSVVPAHRSWKDFRGAAGTLRFDDGAVELELAVDPTTAQGQGLTYSDRAGRVVTKLPADTSAALGMSLSKGWFDALVGHLAELAGQGQEDLMSQLEVQAGLELPEDAETLAGDAFAVALGKDFDPEAFTGSDDPAELPIGAIVQGDAERISAVLGTLESGPGADRVAFESDGDLVRFAASQQRLDQLATGGLGDSETFAEAVPDPEDAGAVLFLDFDSAWLDTVLGGDQQAKENLEPLSAFGLTASEDGGVSRVVLRLTTD